ncbi:hypothetical protein DRN97_02190 [Methanosarcinales archaeon]|nr:MAG: hypothetical protein DRN97_02190 [Methanosarcinales archaeon]
MKKKIIAAMLIATLLVGVTTATSAHTMRGIEFTIDQPNPKPVITIITDNGNYTFENENSQRLLCPFGLVRIISELDKAIKNNVTITQNNWKLIKVENNNSNEMSEDDEEALEEEEKKEENESKINATESIEAIRAAVMRSKNENNEDKGMENETLKKIEKINERAQF